MVKNSDTNPCVYTHLKYMTTESTEPNMITQIALKVRTHNNWTTLCAFLWAGSLFSGDLWTDLVRMNYLQFFESVLFMNRMHVWMWKNEQKLERKVNCVWGWSILEDRRMLCEWGDETFLDELRTFDASFCCRWYFSHW